MEFKSEEYLRRKWREDVSDPSTGFRVDEMKAALEAAVAGWRKTAHWDVVKARMFEMFCDKAAIDVSPHDWFPAFALWTMHSANKGKHPVRRILYLRSREIDAKYCPDVASRILAERKACRWHGWKDFDHSVPDFDAVLPLGFPGLRKRLLDHWRDEPYYVSRKIAADAMLRMLDRFIAQARKVGLKGGGWTSERIRKEHDSLKRLREGAPETAYDVLMFIYLLWVMSENGEKFQVRTLAHLDRVLTPYYRADLAAGRTSEAEFREQMKHFWWQWGSIDNYYGQPVCLGGTRSDGTTEYNEVSRIILEVHDELALPTPKVLLKTGRSTPDWAWRMTLDMARRQRPVVFVGEKGVEWAFRAMGYSAEDARTGILKGCYEYAPRDAANDTGVGHVNFLKPIEMMLREAEEGRFSAERFEGFKAEYLRRLHANTVELRELVNVYEAHIDEINPSMILSLCTEHSVKTGKDAFFNGCARGNNSTILSAGIGSAADALAAVEEIVYVKRLMSLQELGKVMSANWKGHEALRLRMLRSKRKWGNNDPEVNAMAGECVKAFASAVNGFPNSRGGRFYASGHSARFFIVFGKKTGATPDGRLAGEEMSKNVSPVMGADTEGATAMVNSLTTLDSADLPGDFPADVMLLPYTVSGEAGLAAMRNLVEVYHAKGGCQMHFNVFDAATLLDAQKNPHRYENLQVRVCGWNVRWNDMCKEEQDAYIRRAESIMR